MKSRYELNKTKLYLKNIFLWILIAQILSLIFFTMIGKFEKTDTDMILQSSKGIITLSSTVTLTILTIYVTIILNKMLVVRYIGNFRERTYIYPSGRDTMFRNKLYAILYRYISRFIFIMLIVNFVYYFLFEGTNIFSKPISIVGISFDVFNIVVLSALVSITILLLSIILGTRFQSINISLITSIVLIAIIGNVVANSFVLNVITILLINICICIADYVIIKYLLNKIKNDDIMV